MYIDLAKVDEKGIVIDDVVSFGPEYIKNTSIQSLENVKVNGRAYYSVTSEIVFECKVEGSMVLLDAIDLEPVDYPFSFEISEILSENDDEKDQNELKTLDIMDILWQNIVLEVPISYRKDPNKTYSLSGDGWELVDEERKKLDPRLAPLLELLEKEGKE
ncbi:MAG: YceD family protein [Candidatus Coprovivens sp.]